MSRSGFKLRMESPATQALRSEITRAVPRAVRAAGPPLHVRGLSLQPPPPLLLRLLQGLLRRPAHLQHDRELRRHRLLPQPTHRLCHHQVRVLRLQPPQLPHLLRGRQYHPLLHGGQRDSLGHLLPCLRLPPHDDRLRQHGPLRPHRLRLRDLPQHGKSPPALLGLRRQVSDDPLRLPFFDKAVLHGALLPGLRLPPEPLWANQSSTSSPSSASAPWYPPCS